MARTPEAVVSCCITPELSRAEGVGLNELLGCRLLEDDMNESKQARQHDELIAELLDSRVPKTEREHAAAREIERLRGLCDDLYSDLLAAGSLTPRDCGAYSLIQETIRLRRDRWARPMQPN